MRYVGTGFLIQILYINKVEVISKLLSTFIAQKLQEDLVETFTHLLYEAFYIVFYKAFLFKPFKILFRVLTSISHENAIEMPLASKKSRLAKFYLVDAWS